ncbi:hypothetical protein A7U60_g9096 [Sanghuangporus baumii]|uniref:Transmembrane protein n=1 Tax=Sanghuangporus baumii TaxID=108892 RepID=A0A9Q5HQ19_SANBA|nr:hypothetical protein A7U60_g9096 [Sanghuangporus baumii]
MNEAHRRLSIILKVLLATEACLKLGLNIFFDVTAGYVIGQLVTGPTVCGQANYSSVTLGLIDWIIPMVYNLVLMILAVYKAGEYWRMSAGLKGFQLVKVVIKDQIIYFILIVACCIVDILQFKIQVASLFWTGVLGSLGNPSFLCILGTRMLFNLKEAGELGVNEGTSSRVPSGTISEMDFS